MRKITRRSFLAAAAVCGAAAALTACGVSSASSTAASSVASSAAAGSAAASGDTYTIGICQLVQHAALDAATQGFEDALTAEFGDNVKFDFQNAQNDSATCATIANGFVSAGVDLIMANATPALQAAQAATNSIPILGTSVTEYGVALGLTDFDGTVGGNVSGTSDLAPLDQQAEMITEWLPDVKKVGLLYDVGQDSSTKPIADAKAYLEAKGIEVIERTGTTVDEVTLAAKALVSDGVQAVFTPTDNTIMKSELSIYEIFADAKIPQYAGADSFALNGAFLGYGVDYAKLGVETANMIIDIMINGKDPATTPVLMFDNGTATINTEICAKLGYNFDEVSKLFAPKCTEVKSITTAESFSDVQQ